MPQHRSELFQAVEDLDPAISAWDSASDKSPAVNGAV